jgi:hypothetical protein
MKAAPLYATDTDVLALALCDEGYESVKALFQAGLGKHLPHPQALVEVSAPGRRERTFVFLAEKRIDVTVNDTFTIHSDFVAGCVVLRPVVVDGHECEVLLIESCGP